MRSFSLQVGRLFGVEVRLHLTFLILPVFVFWTEYSVHGSANGPRDLALVGIVLACVAAHEAGHMLVARREGLIPKAVILLPLSGVTVFDESRTETPRSAAEVWKRDVRIALVGPLVNLMFAIIAAGAIFAIAPGGKSVGVALVSIEQPAAQPGVGEPLFGWLESFAGLSPGWRQGATGFFRTQHRSCRSHAARRFHQSCAGDDSYGGRFVQQYLAHHGGCDYFFSSAA